ncbi:glycosyltransferase family 87 protein [Methylobacterium durans]|uniref:DUF2029 domain-containing protein n=1 Tax=Methylobacterium durans TaxID=2202825 RepID=A0A2U8W2Z5_9HYPH|nr:glycosyltransferase family 87 protein [Methylobacterium durans]AWN39646.1 hypothetical protein DK389_02745 [Methylobacterium durans]
MMGLRRAEIGIVVAGLAVTIGCWLLFRPWDTAGFMIGVPFGRDFVNFWISPRLALDGRADVITDLPAYGAVIRETFRLAHDPGLLFVYPPHTLLFLVPFALLPFWAAAIAWAGLNLAALAATFRLIVPPDEERARTLLIVTLASPPAAAMVMYGHFGGLIALAGTLAILESERRPWLAGLCLACLSVKPQFASVLGFILLCGGRWRWLPSAILATLALAVLSVTAFGTGPWERFVLFTLPLQSAYIADFKASVISTCISVYFALRFLGAPAALAWAAQGVVTLFALAAAVLTLRGRCEEPRALLVILLAAIVALPYASHYELAIVAPALTLVVFERGRSGGAAPLAAAAWILAPLAKLLYLLGLPILSLTTAAALVEQALRSWPGMRGARAPVGNRVRVTIPATR